MKTLLLLLSIFIVVSCSTTANKKIVVESKKLEPMTFEQKKMKIRSILANHSEFSLEKRVEIEKLLIGALEKGTKLRERESQLLQQVVKYTIVKQGTAKQILALKSELKKIYDLKFENFSKTINNLKVIIGLASMNDDLANDFKRGNLFEVFR